MRRAKDQQGRPEQVELDIEYLTHRNVLMNAQIILRTIPAVLFARGAY
jgi:lipopolysaccharide/colanic/teichoic acid biosynthesis glycosyltransferase